jgi:hypothetical protein
MMWCPLFRIDRDISSGHTYENHDCWLIKHNRGHRLFFYPVTVSEQILLHMIIKNKNKSDNRGAQFVLISIPINCWNISRRLRKYYLQKLTFASEYLCGQSEWCLQNMYRVSQLLKICIFGCHFCSESNYQLSETFFEYFQEISCLAKSESFAKA